MKTQTPTRQSSRLSARDDFDTLRSEQEQSERKFEVKDKSSLGQLVALYEKHISNDTAYNWDHVSEEIRKIATREQGISAKDIQSLSRILRGYEREKVLGESSGGFLTDCFGICRDNEITIDIRDWTVVPESLSVRARKTVTINGNVGHIAGDKLYQGKLIINGNAKELIGWGMQSGEIHLNGEYGSLIGQKMILGGSIFYKGKPIVLDGRVL